MPIAHPAEPYGGSDNTRFDHTLADQTLADPMLAAPTHAEGASPYTEADDRFGSLTYLAHDDLAPDERWSRWNDLDDLATGPEPRPDWVITGEAIDTDLGTLKSGKEATCYLLQRTGFGYLPDGSPLPDPPSVIMVGKVYRTSEHSHFHRKASYLEGRTVRNTRDRRAMAKGSSYGQQVSAATWAQAEWSALVRLWRLGVPVPYPVQLDDLEICMELITDADGTPADRLVQARPGPDALADTWRQLHDAMITMVRAGLVHGDLSPYNLLLADPATQPRLVIIDVPQLVDLAANPGGFDLLHRDCANVVTWFVRRGLDLDAEEVFADLVAQAF